MRVLFLDIDGVCNSAAYAKRIYEQQGYGGLMGIDPVPARMVREIVERTGCSVVLSSTWRLWQSSRDEVRRDVVPFIDCTKDMQRGAKRGEVERGYEVAEWLSRHPAVTQYAILDDDSDFLPGQWLFKTDFSTGLTPEIAQAVVDHLTADRRAYQYS